jgi:hypothetical protein
MAEQPVNLSTAIYLGVFSRPEQRVLQAIFKAIVEGGGRCVATLAMLARNSNTSKSTTPQRDRSSGHNWPSRKNRASLLLRSLASQHSELREALMVP